MQRLLISAAFFVFILIKWQGAFWVQHWYNAGFFDLLNHLSASVGHQSIAFYQGRVEEELWGPLTQLISGLTFAWICLLWLKDSSTWKFALAVFLYLFITKFDIATLPPYGDPISGPWVEAVWLARHSFDYIGLSQQPEYDLGGPKVYLFSLYPGFLAILIKLIPWVKALLFVNHMLTFAMSAVIVAIVRCAGLRCFSKAIAVLTALIVLSLPLFQAQSEAINMEIPSLFFVMLTAYFLIQRRFGLACLYAVTAMFVKGSGLIACLSVFMVSGIDWLLDRSSQAKKRNFCWGCLAIGFIIFQVFLKYLIHDHSTVHDMGLLHGWQAVTSTCIFKIFILCAAIPIFVFLLRSQGQNPWDYFKMLWNRHYPAFVMFICAFNWLSLFVNFAGLSPRYKIILCGLLVFCVVFTVYLLVPSPRFMTGGLLLALGVSLLASYGLLENRIKESHCYDYLLLDRSLEYRNDHRLYIRTAKELERNYADTLIGAQFIMAQALAIPELGYVHRQLKVMAYDNAVQYEGVRQFFVLEELRDQKTIWVGFDGGLNPVLSQIVKDFPVDPQQDVVVDNISIGNRKIAIFKGGHAIDKVQKIILSVLSRQ